MSHLCLIFQPILIAQNAKIFYLALVCLLPESLRKVLWILATQKCDSKQTLTVN